MEDGPCFGTLTSACLEPGRCSRFEFTPNSFSRPQNKQSSKSVLDEEDLTVGLGFAPVLRRMSSDLSAPPERRTPKRAASPKVCVTTLDGRARRHPMLFRCSLNVHLSILTELPSSPHDKHVISFEDFQSALNHFAAPDAPTSTSIAGSTQEDVRKGHFDILPNFCVRCNVFVIIQILRRQ